MALLDFIKRWQRRDALPQAAPDAPAPEAAYTVAPVDDYGGPERRLALRLNALPGTRMLVIDDSSTIRALLRKLLAQNGYEVLEAADAEQGLALARERRPALVFLDIVLPGMDGFNALRVLRREPDTRDIPVIMISGNAQATEQFYVQRIGADDFMKKPFARAEVFSRIEALLDEARVPRRVRRERAAG